ncbi:hypothetical protein, partial [Serratia marcescens]|uniref:hypothetical protein n=1 Tax=Serratia marcescens TaxID=615 RepID=UPI001C6FD600
EPCFPFLVHKSILIEMTQITAPDEAGLPVSLHARTRRTEQTHAVPQHRMLDTARHRTGVFSTTSYESKRPKHAHPWVRLYVHRVLINIQSTSDMPSRYFPLQHDTIEFIIIGASRWKNKTS